MAYQPITTRTTADANASDDINQLNENIESQLQYGIYENAIINGGFTVSQRGDFTSAAAAVAGTYYTDRWYADFTGVTANRQHITSSQPTALKGTNSFRVTATSTATGYIAIRQPIDALNILAGETVTFSAYVKSNTTCYLYVNYNTASISSSAHSGGGDWELLTATGALGASLSALDAQVSTFAGGTVSQSNGDYVEITGAVMTRGTYTPKYSLRHNEYELCQSYYEEITSDAGRVIATGGIFASNSCDIIINYYPKRTNPTVAISGTLTLSSVTSSANITSFLSTVARRNTASLLAVAGFIFTPGEVGALITIAASDKITIDAEL